MIEFGSDFHCIDGYISEHTHLEDIYRGAHFVANGRMCVCALIKQYGWKRIWMPEYFCHEVIESIRKTDVEVMLYVDYPGNNDRVTIGQLPFENGDVLFRMNYFGMRDFRSTDEIPVPVIEDHTHDLLGHWALFSKADWCIASLRKTYPIPEGGMLWSPKGYKLTVGIKPTSDNEKIAHERWQAMQLKSEYLATTGADAELKTRFREIYLRTEDMIDHLQEIAAIDRRSQEFVENFDHNYWYDAKRRNLKLLKSLVKLNCIESEDQFNNVFSFVVLFKDKAERDLVRQRLTTLAVYTTVLWTVPDTVSVKVKDYSERMLSVHCDGRYTEDDIRELANRINKALEL